MKILLFGATGSVGNTVLDACVAAPVVEEVRAITRRPLINTSAKLRTHVHLDFLDYSTAQEALRGSTHACFAWVLRWRRFLGTTTAKFPIPCRWRLRRC